MGGAFRQGEKKLAQDKVFAFVFLFCVISILSQGSLIVASWSKLPPQVPLLYSLPWGEKILADPYFLWLLPTLATFFIILNIFIAILVAKENLFLTKALYLTNFVISFATLYNVVKIVSLLV
jgi:hypothetical protein